MGAELILSELCSLEIEQETKHFLKASSFQFYKYNDKIYSYNQKLCDAVLNFCYWMYIPRFLSWQAGKSLRKHLSPLYCLFPAFSRLNQLPPGRWTIPKVCLVQKREWLDQLTFQDSDIEVFCDINVQCEINGSGIFNSIPRTEKYSIRYEGNPFQKGSQQTLL